MTNFNGDDLRDPNPPVPSASARAAVTARAGQLSRRRRLLQGAGALGVVALLAVGVGTFALSGTDNGSSTQRISAANPPATTDAPATTAPVTTVAPLPPAPVNPDVTTTEPADNSTEVQTDAPPPAPATASVSGSVALEPGASLRVDFSGDGGSFSTTADASGYFSLSGLPAGTYTVVATRTSAPAPPGEFDLSTADTVVKDTVNLQPGANTYNPAF